MVTTDPIGELIEAAKENHRQYGPSYPCDSTCEELCPHMRLERAIAAVEQMRRDVKRPELRNMDDDVAWCLASDVREVLDLLLGGTK